VINGITWTKLSFDEARSAMSPVLLVALRRSGDERCNQQAYIVTDDVKALYAEYSALAGVKISRPLCEQEYGMTEFDVMDLTGHRLVFAQSVK